MHIFFQRSPAEVVVKDFHWSHQPLGSQPQLYFTRGRPQVGRVKIQVYRGPSKGTGYDAFAPWGYYNTQPVDLGPHH